MNKKIIYGFILIIFAVCLFTGTALASSNGLVNGYGIDGTTVNAGTQSNPYAINDFADLQAISSYNWGNGVYYEQTANITLQSSVSISFSLWGSGSFIGNYNGGGYAIDGDNLYYIRISGNGKDKATIANVVFMNIYLGQTVSPVRIAMFTAIAVSNSYFININFGTNVEMGGLESVGGSGSYPEGCKFENCIVYNFLASTGTTSSPTNKNKVTTFLGGYSDSTASKNGYVTNCVVIGGGITKNGAAFDTKRIAWSSKMYLSNNYATNGGDSASGENGLSITSTQYNDKTWWENTAGYDMSSSNAVWEWDTATQLPKLKHSSQPPSISSITVTSSSPAPVGSRVIVEVELENTPATDLGNVHVQSSIDGATWTWLSSSPISSQVDNVVTITYTGQDTANNYLVNAILEDTTQSITYNGYAHGIYDQVRLVTTPTLSDISISQSIGKLQTAYTPTITIPITGLGGAETVYLKAQEYNSQESRWDDTDVSGTTTATGSKTLTLSVNDNTATTHQYRVLVSSLSDYTASVTATSNTVTFQTFAPPATPTARTDGVSSIIVNVQTTVGLTATLPTAPQQNPYTYYWYKVYNGVTTPLGVWANTAIPYQTTETFSSTGSVTYYLTVTDSLSQSTNSNDVVVPIVEQRGKMKVYNGSAWVEGDVYVYNGSAWVQASAIYVYNGTTWEESV